MPLYEYECEACGRRFELLQGADATGTDVDCPGCASPRVHRVLSTFAAGSSRSPSPGAGSCGSGFT